MTNIVAISDSKSIRSISDFESKYYKKEQEHNYFKIFSHYVQSSVGTYRLFKILIDGCRWPIHFAHTLAFSEETIKKLFNLEGNFKFIAKNLILAKYPSTIVELNKSYDDYKKAQISDYTKRRDRLASKVAQTVSDTSFLIQLGEILSLYSLGALSPIINFTGNFFMLFFHGFSLKIDSEEYLEHDKMQKIVEGQKAPAKRLQALFHEIKNLDLLNIAKSIASIALSTFLIFDIVLKTTVITAGSLLLLSTCATVLAIWSHFYKESMTYPQVF